MQFPTQKLNSSTLDNMSSCNRSRIPCLMLLQLSKPLQSCTCMQGSMHKWALIFFTVSSIYHSSTDLQLYSAYTHLHVAAVCMGRPPTGTHQFIERVQISLKVNVHQELESILATYIPSYSSQQQKEMHHIIGLSLMCWHNNRPGTYGT